MNDVMLDEWMKYWIKKYNIDWFIVLLLFMSV